MIQPSSPPLRTYDDLLRLFQESETPKPDYAVGPEMEKFGIIAATGEPLPYKGERGVLALFDVLSRDFGWKPESEYAGGPPLLLNGHLGSITLEPGAQFELSGKAVKTIHEIDEQFRRHLRELENVSRALGIRWLGVGFHPFARREDLEWVPKLRYEVMRKYLPTRGAHALDMMLRTATVQANFDFADERTAMRQMRVALALTPFVTAMFANSPWKEGKRHEGLSYRARVWLDVDPDRSGLIPNLWKKNAGYADYVEWALDAPMFLFKRDGHIVPNTGQTFRSFWKDGFQEHRATSADWELHLNTLFPEVRLKRTVEVRGADSQRTELASALVALWVGILYDERAFDEAEALVDGFQHDELAALREQTWIRGLAAEFRGKSIVTVAESIVEIARRGLERRAERDETGRDETIFLARLAHLVSRGMTPAEAMLQEQGTMPLARYLFERGSLLPPLPQ